MGPDDDDDDEDDDNDGEPSWGEGRGGRTTASRVEEWVRAVEQAERRERARFRAVLRGGAW